MEQNGHLVYLDIDEQKLTGYSSPVDMRSFDLHGEREAADAERDRLEGMVGADDDEITHSERASLPKRLERARVRSETLREMSKLAALNSMLDGDA